jgi:quinol monooxygenase YgiN
MNAPVIRISVGKFDVDKATLVESKLRESRAKLETGIRAMRGNLAYYVGIDQTNHAMHNISVWESVADADQMATFAPMLALAADFTTLGVRFERPILNCDTLWQLAAR